MHIIVCVDDRMGMLYNHRRQSQDRVLREKLLELAGVHSLRMNAYSAKQFGTAPEGRIAPSEDFLSQARAGDYCFVEDQPLAPYAPAIESLILCRWNRDYPGDFFLDLPLEHWHRQVLSEFPGSSHEKITLEVYKP